MVCTSDDDLRNQTLMSERDNCFAQRPQPTRVESFHHKAGSLSEASERVRLRALNPDVRYELRPLTLARNKGFVDEASRIGYVSNAVSRRSRLSEKI